MAFAVLVLGCGDDGGDDTVDAGADSDAAEVCSAQNTPDEDGDTIADIDEGAAEAVDSDDDGTPDSADSDSDGDGINDTVEAGDGDVCSAPRDSDRDTVPDFRDIDSDNNSIPDSAEGDGDLDGDGEPDRIDRDDDDDRINDNLEVGDDPTAPRDTDDDGIPDYQDLESDGDGIPDSLEGWQDPDGDGLPSAADLDADGDGIPDVIEAGSNPSAPADCDGDGLGDYLDTDSDGDGLGDSQEDTDGDGELDPGESLLCDDDTDDDGFPDVVEWAAGTDPQDPKSGLSDEDFFFVLPFIGDEQQDDLDFGTEIRQADVFFQIDATGSMGGTISTLQNTLQTVIVPGIIEQVDDVAMGAAYFRDFPFGGFGGSSDLPFFLTQRITTDIGAVQSGIDVFFAAGGGDGPESGMEALYQAVTGEGISWNSGTLGEVPKFNPFLGYNPDAGHGILGGAGFRRGALPIIVHATDISFHDGSEYWGSGAPDAHTRDEAVAAAQAAGARFIGITSSSSDKPALRAVSRDTSALVYPDAWGAGEILCRTGPGGSGEPPDGDGLCPLTFSMDFGGSGVDSQVVDAIAALVRFSPLNITSLAAADPSSLPAVNTAQFITAITPVAPAPPGAVINGDGFENVLPGQPVQFRVNAYNGIVPGTEEAQLFRVTIRVVGDGVTVLDQREVFIIVPSGGGVD